MERRQYIVLTQCIAEREAEFEDWYDNVHLADVCKVDGVVGARRYRIERQLPCDVDVPNWYSIVMYDIESDDHLAVLDEIAARVGTELMPVSEAVHPSGMIRLDAKPMGSKP